MSEEKSKVAYISGPMEGYDNFNFPAFIEAERLLKTMGITALSPAQASDIDSDDPHAATQTREWFMRRDLKWVLEADMVVVLDGWEMSRGARLEVANARAIGLSVLRIVPSPDPEVWGGIYLEEVSYRSSLEEAQDIAGGGDRQRKYGHPLFNMTRTAQIWAGILGVPITAEQVALCMIGVKLARESFMPNRDNVVDIAGYSLVYEAIEKGRETLARGGTLPNVRKGGNNYPDS